MKTAKIDEMNWIRCRSCGHKLGRIIKDGGGDLPMIEIKCHSCKELNVIGYNTRLEEKRLEDI